MRVKAEGSVQGAGVACGEETARFCCSGNNTGVRGGTRQVGEPRNRHGSGREVKPVCSAAGGCDGGRLVAQ